MCVCGWSVAPGRVFMSWWQRELVRTESSMRDAEVPNVVVANTRNGIHVVQLFTGTAPPSVSVFLLEMKVLSLLINTLVPLTRTLRARRTNGVLCAVVGTQVTACGCGLRWHHRPRANHVPDRDWYDLREFIYTLCAAHTQTVLG